ncbi:MAG: TolC family protein [Desulfobacteraceae bacterium]|nr:MAG: TolC family protein [Desulfobacteraceae bacterium]
MKGTRFAWTVLVFTLVPACSGYKNLVEEWKGYGPTPFYKSQVSPTSGREIPPTRGDDEFQKELADLREMRAEWEKALGEPMSERGFYQPGPGLLETLAPLSMDAAATSRRMAGRFSLEVLETLAFLRSPGIKAAKRDFQAALEGYSQVSNLDEILRQYSAFTEALMTGIGPMRGGESIEVKFPFPGVLSLKGEIVTQEVRAAGETLEIARRTAITAARQSYWNLLYLRKAQEITGEMLDLLTRIDAVATNRYETGRTNFQDLIKIRIEREILLQDLITLGEEQRNLEVSILEILDLPPTAPLGPPEVRTVEREVPPLTMLYKAAVEKRQELQRLRARIGKMERMILMAETAVYPVYSPDLSLFRDVAVSEVGSWRTKEPFPQTTTAEVGAGLPKMPWYGKNDAYLRETRQKLASLRQELEKAEQATFTEVRQAWFRLDRARREEVLYSEQVVRLSQAALESSTRGYETGLVSFADVIASYTTWLRANLSLPRKRSDLGVSRAQLEEAVGVPLKELR